MDRTGKRRLLKLADLLEADAANKKGIKFNFNALGRSSTVFWTVDPEWRPRLDCGTTACAMGLAAVSGAFKRAGLSYELGYGGVNHIQVTMRGKPIYYNEAAQELFGITEREADFLFTPLDQYSTANLKGAGGERKAAKRIRDFAAGKIPQSSLFSSQRRLY